MSCPNNIRCPRAGWRCEPPEQSTSSPYHTVVAAPPKQEATRPTRSQLAHPTLTIFSQVDVQTRNGHQSATNGISTRASAVGGAIGRINWTVLVQFSGTATGYVTFSKRNCSRPRRGRLELREGEMISIQFFDLPSPRTAQI